MKTLKEIQEITKNSKINAHKHFLQYCQSKIKEAAENGASFTIVIMGDSPYEGIIKKELKDFKPTIVSSGGARCIQFSW